MAKHMDTANLECVKAGHSSSIDRRFAVLESVDVTAVLGTTPEIDFRNYAGGKILLDASAAATYFNFYEAEKEGGTYRQLYDIDGNVLRLPSGSASFGVSRTYPIPDECFGSRWVKIVGDDAATPDIVLKG